MVEFDAHPLQLENLRAIRVPPRLAVGQNNRCSNIGSSIILAFLGGFLQRQ